MFFLPQEVVNRHRCNEKQLLVVPFIEAQKKMEKIVIGRKSVVSNCQGDVHDVVKNVLAVVLG
jgi:cobalamin-dependent methionine synthase I